MNSFRCISYCALLWAGFTTAANAQPFSEQDVIKSYSVRQSQIKSFRFSWKEVTRYFQNPDSTELTAARAKIEKEKSPEMKALLGSQLRTLQMPSNDTTHDYELAVCGEYFKLSGQSTTVNAAGDNETLNLKTAFNGLETKNRSKINARDNSTVDIQRGKSEHSYHAVLEDMACRPIFLFCRPKDILQPRISQGVLNANQLRKVPSPKGAMVVMGGSSAATHHGYSTSYWFFDQPNLAVVHEVNEKEGVPTSRLTIEYSEDKRFGLVPSSWVWEKYWPNGATKQKSESQVASYDFNFECNSAEFDIPLIPGDKISDRRLDQAKYLTVASDLSLVPRDSIPTKRGYWLFRFAQIAIVGFVLVVLCFKFLRKR